GKTMKKLKLTVDALHVESFETAEKQIEQRGTVRGKAVSDTTCWQRGCFCPGATNTTCEQEGCWCTAASEFDASCATCNHHLGETCYEGCETFTGCNTSPGHLGC
ncbi:hypothetical protein, partial [Longimicrobium sp.]|uniref:hypothetical protein n=1 Tax=Longimicrobium sp. TaxID=2029185 RepID=UPI002B9372A9